MTKQDVKPTYKIRLSFEEIRLPPFDDILILGKKCPQGKIGVRKSFEFLIPNEFESFEVVSDVVDAVFINKRLLKKMNKDIILKTLEDKVFPYVYESEILKVNFKLEICYDLIEIEDIN